MLLWHMSRDIAHALLTLPPKPGSSVCQPALLTHFSLISQRFFPLPGHRVIRNSTAPTTLIVSLLFTTLLLHNIQQLHGKGWPGFAPPVPLLAFLLGSGGIPVGGLASHRAERALRWFCMAGPARNLVVVDIVVAASH